MGALKKLKNVILETLFGIVFIYHGLLAVNYYVSTTGNDLNDGLTPSTAWQHIYFAASNSNLLPGDVVNILAGTYNETIVITRSGNSSSNIIFKPYTNGVIIRRPEGANENCIDIQASYIKLVNLKISNNSTDGTGYGNGIRFNNNNNKISNLEIFRFSHGIYLQGSSQLIKKTIIRNNSYGICEGPGLNYSIVISNQIIFNNSGGITHNGQNNWNGVNNNIYDGNYIARNGGYAFWADYHGAENQYINNSIFSNGYGWSIRDPGGGGSGNWTKISNNKFIGNSGGSILLDNWDAPPILIYNNYFSNNGSCAIGPRAWISHQIQVQIKNNLITSHSLGIDTYPISGSSTIKSNIIRNCSIGISVNPGGGVSIVENWIYTNTTGIDFSNNTGNASVSKNKIYKNNNGLYVRGVLRTISENMIYSNYSFGIYLNNVKNNSITYNKIKLNRYGIGYENTTSTNAIELNNITSNNYGIVYYSGDMLCIHKNNIYLNQCFNLSNVNLTAVKITNNWWGSTIASNIAKKMFNITDYSNFIPYRLFTTFDMTPGADTTPPDRVVNLTSQISNNKVKLKWNKVTNSDFVRYSIYRSSIPGITNLSRNNVITNIYNVNVTNIETELLSGIWYYTATALDNKFIYTNESWYSLVTPVTCPTTTLKIYKSIYNVTLGGNPVFAIPGSTITYRIIFSNLGAVSGNKTIIYDKIFPQVTFSTAYLGSATNFLFQYSTNITPDQSYDSSDYITGNPPSSIKSKVKWIRWKKENVYPYEDGKDLFYKVIIK
jgi:hypothetical protein